MHHTTQAEHPYVKSATAETSGLRLIWSNDCSQLLPWFWVRDHGTDSQSQHSQTLQRQVDTFSLSARQQAESAVLDQLSQTVILHWNDGQETSITAQRIAQVTGQRIDDEQLSAGSSKVYWHKGSMLDKMPAISCDEVMSSDDGVLNWLMHIDRYGFCLVTGTPATELGTERLAKRIAEAQHTIFGTYWPLSSDLKTHDDSAYTTDFLAPHTDASYHHNAPGLQMFNCIEFDGTGGESIVVDGFAIAQKIQQQRPDLYAVLCNVIVPAHYKEPGVHLAAQRPVISKNRQGQLAQVTFNNYDRSPFILPEQEMNAFYEAYALFSQHSMDQDNWLKIPLRPGTALIFDNWRCLHGRMGYSGRRNFFGCYHDKADYESRIRTLQHQLQRR